MGDMRRSRFSSRLATSSASGGRSAARSFLSRTATSPSSSPSPLTPPPNPPSPPGRKGSPPPLPPPGKPGKPPGERYTRKCTGAWLLLASALLLPEPSVLTLKYPEVLAPGRSSSLISPLIMLVICSTRARSTDAPPAPSPPSSPLSRSSPPRLPSPPPTASPAEPSDSIVSDKLMEGDLDGSRSRDGPSSNSLEVFASAAARASVAMAMSSRRWRGATRPMTR
mmetsp:Transcript_79861/g.158719  ORF Transcript_79861/g.158719 Transcript_79861/m.158719 type:complete len:224 (+) Transcript_79861:2621-3292(+)